MNLLSATATASQHTSSIGTPINPFRVSARTYLWPATESTRPPEGNCIHTKAPRNSLDECCGAHLSKINRTYQAEQCSGLVEQIRNSSPIRFPNRPSFA